MSKEVLDMAVPLSLESTSDYYRQNMANILNSSSSSTINSTDNHNKDHEMYDCCSISTASDSDIDDQFKENKVPPSLNKLEAARKLNESSDSFPNLQDKLQNINSVSVISSNNVHVGNKTFFNGPVTIKHIVVNNEDNIDSQSKKVSFGVLNQGFEGSLNHLPSNSNVDRSQNKKQEEINKELQQNRQISDSKTTKLISRKKILLAVGGLLFVVTVSTLLILILTQQEEKLEPLRIVTRSEWMAQPIKGTIIDLILPVDRVIIAHTVNSECFTKENCTEVVQTIQEMHFGEGFEFFDIGYNFLIGGDGNIYEGRGWFKQGAHTSGYNFGSLGVAYIGNFVSELPNDLQISAGFKLLDEGVRLGVLSNDYVIYGASQLRNTQSPGDTFLELIKTWTHAVKIEENIEPPA